MRHALDSLRCDLRPPILVGTFGATITATLPVTGTCSIGVDPQDAYTSGITLTLTATP